MNQNVKKVRQSLAAVIIIAGFIGFAGITSCEKAKIPPTPFDSLAVMSLKTDIQPVFTKNCATSSCHGGAKSPNLSEGKSFNALKTAYVTMPAANSRLYLKIISSNHVSRTTDLEKLKILNWIKQGALNN